MTMRFLCGDVMEQLRTLPDASVHMVCTSPPYFALRSYLAKDHPDKHKELGSEATPAEYVAKMVEVLREVRRVLRNDGLLFLNLGDSYASSPTVGWRSGEYVGDGGKAPLNVRNRNGTTASGLKPKCLLEMPSRVALALIDDGWILRSRMPWVKRSTMPESCDDRPTSACEYVFMLAKSNTAQFWTHRDLPGARAKPAPDYRWLDTDNDNTETAEEPPNWRTELARGQSPPDDDREYDDDEPQGAPRGKRKRWRRINLWEGHDYYWDADAVRRGVGDNTHSRGTKLDPPREHAGIGHAGWTRATAAPVTSRNFRNSDLFFDSIGVDTTPSVVRNDVGWRTGRAYGGEDDAQVGVEAKRRTLAAMQRKNAQLRQDGNGYGSGGLGDAAWWPSRAAGEPDPKGSEPLGLILDEAGEPLAIDCNPEPFPGAHFATFPTKLVEPLIRAATSERGCCPHCGAPWARVVERTPTRAGVTGGATPYDGHRPDGMTLRTGGFGDGRAVTTDWRATCGCPEHTPGPCTVCDPFSGAGTTCLVADRLQRHAIGIELSAEYIAMAAARLRADAGLFAGASP